jgi:hypothetical protein
MFNLFRPDLRNLPVLAEFAVNVTASRGNGESVSLGKKMEEGFLFYGIDVDGADLPVD